LNPDTFYASSIFPQIYDLLQKWLDFRADEKAIHIFSKADRKTHLLTVAFDFKPLHNSGFSYLAMSKQRFFEVPSII